MIWAAVVVAGVGCYLFKLAGLSVPQRILDRPVVQRVAGLLPIVLLAALIAVQTVGSGQRLLVDARLAGVAVAVVAVWRKWPFLLVVVLGCATTALVRVL